MIENCVLVEDDDSLMYVEDGFMDGDFLDRLDLFYGYLGYDDLVMFMLCEGVMILEYMMEGMSEYGMYNGDVYLSFVGYFVSVYGMVQYEGYLDDRMGYLKEEVVGMGIWGYLIDDEFDQSFYGVL